MTTERTAPSPSTPIDPRDHLRLVTWWLRRSGYARDGYGRGRRERSTSRRREAPPAVSCLDYGDLYAAGCTGLMRAAKDFDASRGCSFSTYALWAVRAAVQREVQNRSSTVRFPVFKQEELRKAGQRTRPAMVRLDLPVSSEDGDYRTLANVLADEAAPSPEDEALAAERSAGLEALMRRARLDARERRVLALRARDESLQDIGAELGVGRERVRQIEAGAVLKLRRAAGVPEGAPPVPITRAERRDRKSKPNRLDRRNTCHMAESESPSSRV